MMGDCGSCRISKSGSLSLPVDAGLLLEPRSSDRLLVSVVNDDDDNDFAVATVLEVAVVSTIFIPGAYLVMS